MDRRKLNVMIVEDSRLIAERLICVLEGLDTVDAVLHAGTYTEALSLFEKQVPDVLLLDIGLPDKSGIYLLQIVKQNKWETKVIIVTNEANEFYKRLCIRIGADAFLDKSNDFEKIADILNEIQ
jgi:two-component system invasion response regulator UvrY